jgi:hypothetical protein
MTSDPSNVGRTPENILARSCMEYAFGLPSTTRRIKQKKGMLTIGSKGFAITRLRINQIMPPDITTLFHRHGHLLCTNPFDNQNGLDR